MKHKCNRMIFMHIRCTAECTQNEINKAALWDSSCETYTGHEAMILLGYCKHHSYMLSMNSNLILRTFCACKIPCWCLFEKSVNNTHIMSDICPQILKHNKCPSWHSAFWLCALAAQFYLWIFHGQNKCLLFGEILTSQMEQLEETKWKTNWHWVPQTFEQRFY